MPVKVTGQCFSCGYPITARVGKEIGCPSCGTINRAITGVTVPTWLIVGMITFAAGVILGPALLTSTEAGSDYLARQVKAKLR